MMNNSLRFICKHQFIRVENTNCPFTFGLKTGSALDIPIAHKEGNYFISSDGLDLLHDNDQIIFKYCDKHGHFSPGSNPNGALDNIAGICSDNRRILGMMPHPERAAGEPMISADGLQIISAVESYFESRA